MEWTRELPTREGWYWFRVSRRVTPGLVFIHILNGLPRIATSNRWLDPVVYEAEWYGPIEPPE